MPLINLRGWLEVGCQLKGGVDAKYKVRAERKREQEREIERVSSQTSSCTRNRYGKSKVSRVCGEGSAEPRWFSS